MENLKTYNEYLNEDVLNEGFLTKTVLALSLAFASLFVPVKAHAYTPTYPVEFKIMNDDYDNVLRNIRGLTEHINDPKLTELLNEVEKLHSDLDGMGVNNFMIRFNHIKPKLVDVVRKYGVTNYNIEQICNHITAKDFKRASVDMKYIRIEIEKIAAKYQVTTWERMATSDVVLTILLSVVGILMAGLIGFAAFDIVGDAIRNVRWRRRERRRRREAALHPPIHHPPVVHPPVAHQPVPGFNRGARVTYIRDGSEHNGKMGTIRMRRNDGKYCILFDDGRKLAASPQRLILHDEPHEKEHENDPFHEENWED